MARFNQLAGRSPSNLAFRAAGTRDRRTSLESRGADVAATMAQLGCGERRAMAEIERRMGLIWLAGGFGDQIRGHSERPAIAQEPSMYAIFNLNTGKQHKATSRGFSKFCYDSKFAAEQAIAAMPRKYRTAYAAMTLEQGRELADRIYTDSLADEQRGHCSENTDCLSEDEDRF